MMEALAYASELILRADVLLVVLAASVYGLVIGSIPGLTATMGTALLVAITFFLDPVPAIGAIFAATAMAIFARDIPGAMLRIPGTSASAACTDEAYKMRPAASSKWLSVRISCVWPSQGGSVSPSCCWRRRRSRL